MPSCLLVLQRFFLRVDDVVFRIFDTRMYCSFNPHDGEARPGAAPAPRVIRECRGAQASYAEVEQCLPKHRPFDLSTLTNVAWVADALGHLQEQRLRQAKAAHVTVRPTQDLALRPVANSASISEVASDVPAWEGEGDCVHVAVLTSP